MTGAPLSIWVAVLAIGLAAVVYTNKYGFIERMATISVLSLVVITLLLVLGLPLTPFAYTPDDIVYGLSFDVTAGALGLAVAMFGLTGFTAPEINNYGYWCIEKGYVRWAGLDDGTEQRARRAEGWLKVMHVDMCVAWLITTSCNEASP